MKKLLYALPILALGFFATYCAKEKVPAPTTTNEATEGLTDRGGESCVVTISVDGDVTVCGLAPNATPCKSCTGQNLTGVANLTAGSVVSFAVTPGFPSLPFSITNTSGQPVNVVISTTAVGPQTWTIPSNTCYGYGVATTCYLFADNAHN